MPYSSNTFDDLLQEHVRRLTPTTVLDVGVGAGKNGKLIKSVNNNIVLEGIEPTQKYIDNFKLHSFYDKIYEKEIQQFTKENSNGRYDITIFGDVLEHFFRTEVIDYLDYFLYRSKWVFVIWPSNRPQDDAESNHYEIHKNNFTLNDLTSKFNVVYYVTNFGGWHSSTKIEPSYFHYCILKGYSTSKEEFVYNFANWKV